MGYTRSDESWHLFRVDCDEFEDKHQLERTPIQLNGRVKVTVDSSQSGRIRITGYDPTHKDTSG